MKSQTLPPDIEELRSYFANRVPKLCCDMALKFGFDECFAVMNEKLNVARYEIEELKAEIKSLERTVALMHKEKGMANGGER